MCSSDIDTWLLQLVRCVVSDFDDEAERSLQHTTGKRLTYRRENRATSCVTPIRPQRKQRKYGQ